MNDDLPQGFNARDMARLAKMLRAFEGGQFGPPPKTGSGAGQADDDLVIVVTGYETGGGKYQADLMQPPTIDVAAAGNLSMSELGNAYTAPSGKKIRALNVPELGKSTHAIDVGTPCMASILRRNTDGTLVVVINAYGIRILCQPPEAG